MTLPAGIPITDYGWSLFGAPPEVVATLKLEAEQRDDPLLAMWAEGQEAERRTHEYYDRHGNFNDLPAAEMHRAYALRQEAVRKYAFSVTHRYALTHIAEFVGSRGLVSLGAGTGWWEHRLSDEVGVDVLAYDSAPPGDESNHWCSKATAFYDVQRGGVHTLHDHADRVLFLAWPPYNDKFASCALEEWGRIGGTRVIYIGEGEGGCCADDDFFNAAGLAYEDEDKSRWSVTNEIGLPQWMGIHDAVWCLTRGES